MKARLTPTAAAQADAIDVWWRLNRRDSRALFALELAATLALAATAPLAGTVYRAGGEQVRRLFMRRTRHHVYYTIDADAEEVVVHAVWGAPKHRGPDF